MEYEISDDDNDPSSSDESSNEDFNKLLQSLK